jgi:hypothetical protein
VLGAEEDDVLADETGAASELWAMAQLGTPMAVRVAATLRIADHVADTPRTAADLAGTVDADPDALDRLLRYLSKRHLFSRDGDGRYALTARGEPLRSDHPSGLHAWLDNDAVGRAELSYVQLEHSIRTGEAAFPAQFGHTLWEDLAANPERAESFNTSLGGYVEERAANVVAGYDWGSLGSVVDVGGGNGSQVIALLAEYPRLRGTVVDQPEATEAAREALTAAGLAHRGDAVAGSFFDPLPAGAGGYLLSLVTHNWPDDAVRAILKRCVEAAGPGGRVCVVENVGTDGESPPTGMDLRMLAYCGGKERPVSHLAAIAGDVGLALTGVHPAGALSIVEFTAA